jgi:hypothetical protein
MTPKYFAFIVALLLGFTSQAQVSGFLGKRKSLTFYTDITPAFNQSYTASKKAIEQITNNTPRELYFVGAHVRLGVEYAHVYKRRKEMVGGLEVFRNGLGRANLYTLGGSSNNVFATIHGIKLNYIKRSYGQKLKYSNVANGNIAPLGRFTGLGLQVNLFQFRFHDATKGEAYGVKGLKGATPDLIYEIGRNRVVAGKYLFTTSWRFGVLGLARIFNSNGFYNNSYEGNQIFLRKTARNTINWVDFYRVHLAFSLLK